MLQISLNANDNALLCKLMLPKPAMDDVRGDFLGPPHGTTPAAVIANKI